MGPEMLVVVSMRSGVGYGFEGARGLHFGVFLGVHYGCDGDAEVGGGAPEVCARGTVLAIGSVRCSSASHAVDMVRPARSSISPGVVGLTGRAEVVGHGVRPDTGIECFDCGRHVAGDVCVVDGG